MSATWSYILLDKSSLPTTLASDQVLGLPDHGCCWKSWCWSGEHLFRVALRWRYYGGDGLVPGSCWWSQQHNGVSYALRCWAAIGGKGQRRQWICWVFQNLLVLETVWRWFLGYFPTMYSKVATTPIIYTSFQIQLDKVTRSKLSQMIAKWKYIINS